MPAEARCLTCGYLLRGLPEPVCPECGRRFDPADTSTFDTRPPSWRRRRWVARGCTALAVVLLAFALFPRHILKAELVFKCSQCGETTMVRRWEPKPPRWIPFRYPGFHWTSQTSSSTPTTAPTCSVHQYYLKVRSDLYIGGWCSASGLYTPGETYTINGQLLTLTTAPRVLKSLMSPSNNGIGP